MKNKSCYLVVLPTAIFFLLLVAFPRATYAQKYGTTLGIRSGGSLFGLSFQQRVLPPVTLEAIVGIKKREVSATALAQYHFPILGRSLNYYLGAGGHIGSVSDGNGNDNTFTGLDGMLGIEWKTPILPLNLSFDLKPTYHFNHPDDFQFQWGISVRYVLITDREVKKAQKKREKEANKNEKSKAKSKNNNDGTLNKWWNKAKDVFEKKED